jgi:hypothetical protein
MPVTGIAIGGCGIQFCRSRRGCNVAALSGKVRTARNSSIAGSADLAVELHDDVGSAAYQVAVGLQERRLHALAAANVLIDVVER